jgi:hypothetical protein
MCATRRNSSPTECWLLRTYATLLAFHDADLPSFPSSRVASFCPSPRAHRAVNQTTRTATSAARYRSSFVLASKQIRNCRQLASWCCRGVEGSDYGPHITGALASVGPFGHVTVEQCPQTVHHNIKMLFKFEKN